MFASLWTGMHISKKIFILRWELMHQKRNIRCRIAQTIKKISLFWFLMKIKNGRKELISIQNLRIMSLKFFGCIRKCTIHGSRCVVTNDKVVVWVVHLPEMKGWRFAGFHLVKRKPNKMFVGMCVGGSLFCLLVWRFSVLFGLFLCSSRFFFQVEKNKKKEKPSIFLT